MVLVNPQEANALRQWRIMFNRGAKAAPTIALTAAVSAFTAAYTHHHPQATHRTWLFIASGVSTIGIIPYTGVAMLKNIRTLEAKEDSARVKAEKDGHGGPTTSEDTKSLIRTWSTLNAVRALLPLVGSLLAFEAL